jgi:hypothetical protein
MEFCGQNESGVCRVRKKLNRVVKVVSNWTRHMGWCIVGRHLKWKLNPQDAINPERKTWPGRLRHNGQHLQHRLGTPQDGACISRRPHLTRSLEDARYIHINFRLLADLVVFEQVNAECISVLFLFQKSILFLLINVNGLRIKYWIWGSHSVQRE